MARGYNGICIVSFYSGIPPMIPINTLHAVNPGGNPQVWVFHNTLDGQGVCGFGFARDGEAPQTTCLLVNIAQQTQKILHNLCAEGNLYERQTMLLALAALRLGDVVIDVGAHVGLLSILGRLAVGTEGLVHAFEPLPATYARLRDNITLNAYANVVAHPLALADCPGQAVFYLNAENEGASSLLAECGTASCIVEVSTLDHVFADGLTRRPRLLKLDVEGVEMSVLRGGKRFFTDWAPDLVFCEINRGALHAGGSSEEEIRRFFVDNGYRCAVVNNGLPGLALGEATFYHYLSPNAASAHPDNIYVYNLMFVREEAGLYPEISL